MNLKSGLPFWLVKYGIPFSYPKLTQPLKADVIILGGGISGALTAYHLINAGVDCVLIDARTIGLGSTCASTSLLQYEIDTPLSELKNKVGKANAVAAYKLCAASIKKLGDLSEKIGFDQFSYRQSLYYAANKKDVKFLKEEFAARKENGFDVQLLNSEALKKQFNLKAPSAILSSLGAQTNAYDLTNALHQYSLKKGVRIFDRTMIKHIAHQKKGVTLTTADGYILKAKKLVYATGYEVVQFIDKKIVDLHSTYACISEEATEKTIFWKDEALIWNTADPYLYMRTTPDKRILIGGRDEKFYDPVKRDKLLKYKVKQLSKDLSRVFPDIEFNVEFSWAGTFGATKDGLPFIGNYKKLPNSLFALGFGGNGITFSLIAAEMLTDIITGKKNKELVIFSFDR